MTYSAYIPNYDKCSFEELVDTFIQIDDIKLPDRALVLLSAITAKLNIDIQECNLEHIIANPYEYREGYNPFELEYATNETYTDDAVEVRDKLIRLKEHSGKLEPVTGISNTAKTTKTSKNTPITGQAPGPEKAQSLTAIDFLPQSPWQVKFPSTFKFILMMIAGTYLMSLVAPKLYDLYQTSLWQVTYGHILISQVSEIDCESGSCYRPRIEYGYQVDGKSYQGKDIQVGARLFLRNSRDLAESVIAQYPAGDRVLVYYNHSDKGSTTSVLDFSLNLESYSFAGAGILLFLFGAFGYYRTGSNLSSSETNPTGKTP